ncbi:MAG: class I SAM-dependent methyltransferase, partial [Nitratireductor sp.]|nr:class I SAM-dependent methyltransferase [Nitratireductor sp.]
MTELQPDSRFLRHPRFSRSYALFKRISGKRRRAIAETRALYAKTGLESKGCVNCKSTDFVLLCESDRFGFDLKKQYCNQCGLVQTYPSLPADFHVEFYSSIYRGLYGGKRKVNYAAMMPNQEKRGREIADFVSRSVGKEALRQLNVYEIGCSCGGVLNGLKPLVASVAGCDLDIEGTRWGQENLDIDIQCKAMPEPGEARTPTLYVLSHVLEHLADPLASLQAIAAMMNASDYLYVEVPGKNALRNGSYRHDLRRYFHIGHVTDFTQGTMTNITARAGFRALEINEEVEGLFVLSPDGPSSPAKDDKDSLGNIADIEATRPR